MLRLLSVKLLRSTANGARLFQKRAFLKNRSHCCFLLSSTTQKRSSILQQCISSVNAVPSLIVRHKTSRDKSSRTALNEDDEETEDDEYEDDSDDEDSHFRTTFPEDKGLPSNYKERKAHLSSLRVDAVLSAGLNISRRKIEDFFLGSKIKLNGNRVLKKSMQASEGDFIELVESSDGSQKTKRVRLVKVLRNESGKYVTYLRSWKGGIES